MMLTSHVLIGMLIGSSTQFWAEGLLIYGFIGGTLGGLIPDLDVRLVHRKTLHLPVYYSFLAFLSVVTVIIASNSLSVFIACLTLSLALHSVSDIFSGGLAPQKTKKIAEYPIYNHLRNKWISKPVIRYDGSPEDTAISIFAGLATIYLIEGKLRYLAFGTLLMSLTYFTFRRKFHLYFLSNETMNIKEDKIKIRE